MNRSNYCSCCGALRGLSARNKHYDLHDIVPVVPHRPMQRGDGRMFEMSPQLIVCVQVYRNGGGAATDEHICNDCLLVGIRYALQKLQPLVLHNGAIQTHIAECEGLDQTTTEARQTARRLAACSNICQGISTEQLEQDYAQGYEPWGHVKSLQGQVAALQTAKSVLMDACKAQVSANPNVKHPARMQGQAAIDLAELGHVPRRPQESAEVQS